MSWRERLQPGSFRGVGFKVESEGKSAGRRQIVHKYPGRDEAYIEDNGGEDDVFTLSLYVVGQNYDRERDALEAALDKKGAAELRLPWRSGAIMARAGEYSTTHTTEEQGIARIEVTFYRDRSNSQPTETVDTQDAVNRAADTATQAIAADFTRVYKTDGLPEFVRTSAATRVQDLVTQINEANGILTAAQQPVSDFARDLQQLGNEAATLIRQPVVLASRVVGVLGAVVGVFNDVDSAIRAYEGLANLEDVARPLFNTPSRAQEKANLEAMNNLQAQAAAVQIAKATTQLTFTSRQQSLAVRDRILSLLDKQMLTAGDETYKAMRDLRAKVVEDIRDRGARLARVDSFTPPSTMPSLVVAYRVYGSIDNELDLVRRNDIEQPGFVSGGQSLEVIVDE